MKKMIAIIAIVALTATMAVAYPGKGFKGQGGPCYGAQGQGQEQFKGQGHGRGFGKGKFGQCAKLENAEPVTDERAKELVAEYLEKNLKGYEIEEAVKMEKNRGSVYRFYVRDDNGNMFALMMSPFGHLRGPVSVQSIK